MPADSISARPLSSERETARHPDASGLARWLTPSLADVIFCALLLWLILFTIYSDGTVGLLLDSNTGYHIRTGDYILSHRTVPRGDIFSFSRPGQPWFAWEWLSAILFSLCYSAGGFKALVVFSGAIAALANLILMRHMIWSGANALVTIGLLHMVAAASSIHYLARPHLFTFLLLAVSLWLIDADRRRPSGRIWLLVPIAVLWANLHGGFLALLASLAALAVGFALEGQYESARRYALLAVACTAATGANPYGFAVHAHAIPYLQQKWMIRLVQEFQSPQFGSPEGRYFELLLIAGLALSAQLIARKQYASALLILAWAHAALNSVRHIPIFGFVVAPMLVREATVLWNRWNPFPPPGSIRSILAGLAADHTPGLRRSSVWPAALVLSLALFSFGFAWPADFPHGRYPAGLALKHAQLISGSRIFTTDAWADYLTFHHYPRQKIFVDGRSDFFGQEIIEEYLQILKGQQGWDTLMRRYDFNAVLIPSQSALASLLRVTPGWILVDADDQAVLFRR
ncbi:MAG TPA: hypothetical protein VL285_10720 [Bryobacteraceae bacterium]|nr:hypothetical protein [Bryobacteraceae bacterium]